MEKFPKDHNAFVNSSFIYMDDKKYEKASILLHKVLMTIFHGNNAKIENILTKCCIEMKEFKTANQHIKNLILKYPDNLIYQYNYGFLLYSQFEDIINKTIRKYIDTEKAIKFLSRALKIFEELNKTKKDDRYDKIIQKNEFYYKCEEMLNICKVNLTKAKDILILDKENAETMKKKNEEEYNELKKKLEEQKELEEKEEKEKIKDNEIQDERIKEENMEIMDLINKRNLEIQMEKMKGKEKKGKKRGKKGKQTEEDLEQQFIDDQEEKEYAESYIDEEEDKENKPKPINSDYGDDEEEINNEKPKKRLLLKKRKHSELSEDFLDDKEDKENNNEENNNEENELEKEKEKENEDENKEKEEENNEDHGENNEENKEENNGNNNKMIDDD